ncbi:peptide chain release factor N(5)-glutamine methyltransferase [Labrys monachus]|uniref:Release factor glutamine methyltransferase n=1 Tax=Labrys monachus TaxID=217067 RepID=A0ABU0F7N1_9HYPH|nr:peptide chain release factor N(5)-glutamine methyltransferase [Labrys monachus]MDQ0390619.1 release factor glutamine methyltransferase [Labrys monachus]
MTTLGALYRRTLAALREAGLPTPELDARWLVAEAAGVEASRIVLDGGRALAPEAVAKAEGFVARRLAGEPVDRILGTRDFWGLAFRLAPATLSPRPDTETLVGACLEALPDRQAPYRLLDLGTGTGAILIALLVERPAATGIGIDKAAEAVVAARENARANGVADRACFAEGDWTNGLDGPFDLIVSNPPYIPAADIEGLDREVREHDPRLALDGGEDGLDAYRAITRAAPALLAPGGILALELGIGQEEAVAALMRAAGLAILAPARKDLSGVARALLGRRPG